MQLDRAPVADQLLESLPPAPIVGRIGEKSTYVRLRARVEPFRRAAGKAVALGGIELELSGCDQHVEHTAHARLTQLKVLRQLGSRPRSLGELPKHSRVLRYLQ